MALAKVGARDSVILVLSSATVQCLVRRCQQHQHPLLPLTGFVQRALDGFGGPASCSLRISDVLGIQTLGKSQAMDQSRNLFLFIKDWNHLCNRK